MRHSRLMIRWIALPVLISVGVMGAGVVLAVGEGPKIRLSEETFDFGYTPEGLKANHRYWLANVGSDTLMIQRVRPTCGCTTVPLPKDRIAPADSVPLDLVFDTQKFKGQVHKGVRIFSNEKIEGDTANITEKKIYFTAMVAAEDEAVTIQPQSAYLDTIGKNTQVLTVVNRDKATYKLSVTSPPPGFVSVEFPSEMVPAEGEMQVLLTAGKETPIGVYTGSVTFHFSGPRKFSITVPIYGMGYAQ